MTIKLRDIAIVSAGNSAPNVDEFSSEGIPFIRAGSLAFLTQGDSIDKCEKIDKQIAQRNNLKLFPANSILFAKSGMSAKMGRVYQLPVEAFVVSHIAIIQPNIAIVNPAYLKYYFINEPPFYLIKDDAYPSIKISDIEEIDIDLPDINTQNKIVGILDKASALVGKTQNFILGLEKLLYSEFLNLFGEPYKNTKGWSIQSIDEVVEKISSGWSAQGEQRLKLDGELGVLKISSVTSGEFRPEEHKAIDRNKVDRNIITPKKGDLLFSRANTLELVGATCIVDKDYKDLFLPDKLWKIEPKNEVVKPEYLKSVLSSELFRKNFTQFATGSSGSMLNISQEKFRSIQLPVPPYKVQEQYSALFWKILEIKIKKKGLLKQVLNLEKSISQRFFSGRVIYNIDAELDAFIKNINTEHKTNDLTSLSKDQVLLQRLIDKLNTQEYIEEEMYKKAKYSLLQLLKENKGITQKYNPQSQEIELTLE